MKPDDIRAMAAEIEDSKASPGTKKLARTGLLLMATLPSLLGLLVLIWIAQAVIRATFFH